MMRFIITLAILGSALALSAPIAKGARSSVALNAKSKSVPFLEQPPALTGKSDEVIGLVCEVSMVLYNRLLQLRRFPYFSAQLHSSLGCIQASSLGMQDSILLVSQTSGPRLENDLCFCSVLILSSLNHFITNIVERLE
jgi:hypothetical protein